MGAEKKLKQYIRDDRPKKLKSYIESHNIDVVNVRLSGGRSLLHYCAQHGSTDMLRCLLRLDMAPDKQDHDGNLPLHLAASRCLEEDKNTAKFTFDGIVTPLLTAYPLAQDMENRSGETGYDLVKNVKEKINTCTKDTQKSQVEEEEDEMWRRKLSEEAMFEYQEQTPRYHHMEDFVQEQQTESYDDWSERIRHEMSAKRQNHQSHKFTRDKKKNGKSRNYNDNSNKKKSKEEDEQERLKQAREEMKKRYKPPTTSTLSTFLLLKKQRYEKKFSYLLTHLSGETLTFGCIPWPNINLDLVARTLFCDLPDKQSAVYRKYLKTQQVRWHPDKFTQKFGDHIHPEHLHKIMNRVKRISQILNKLSNE